MDGLFLRAGSPGGKLEWPRQPDEFMSDPAITPELVSQHNLTPEEFEQDQRHSGREPSYTELGIFSVMWSEHCSYKNTRPLLKTFPTKSPRILVGAGEENAGIIDIGDGWPSPSRSNRTIIPARSSRSKARPPASAASSATFSPWARGRFARSIRCASARSKAGGNAANNRRLFGGRGQRHRALRQLLRHPDHRRRSLF